MRFLENIEIYRVRNHTVPVKGRVASVDALRGFDMFWIMGGDLIFKAIDNIFHNRLSGYLKSQMDHVEWLGFHFYDIIMPLFLFLVGVSMVYSFRKRLAGSRSRIPVLRHTFRRVIILWILGMIVQGNLLTYSFEHIHFYTNTLQAIAAGYLVATLLILYLPVRIQITATAAILLLYWAVLALIPVNGTTDLAYTPEGNVAFHIEKAVMGSHIGWGTYTWIASSLNFGATVMLGVFAGYMMQSDRSGMHRFRDFLIFGILLILTGLLLNIWHPIIKKIWSSSFVLFSGGICVLMLAVFYLFIDVWGLKKGIGWMVILGANAITGYVAWHLFDDQFVAMAGVFLEGMSAFLGAWYEMLGYLGGFMVIYLILRYMYKNKTFVKI
jgi:predicted acyltransferase